MGIDRWGRGRGSPRTGGLGRRRSGCFRCAGGGGVGGHLPVSVALCSRGFGLLHFLSQRAALPSTSGWFRQARWLLVVLSRRLRLLAVGCCIEVDAAYCGARHRGHRGSAGARGGEPSWLLVADGQLVECVSDLQGDDAREHIPEAVEAVQRVQPVKVVHIFVV